MIAFRMSLFLLLTSFFHLSYFVATGAPYQAAAPSPEPDPYSPAEHPKPDCSDEVFDVTHFGAIADGVTESSAAFEAAWDFACGCPGNPIFYVPLGVYLVGPVEFSGPCLSSKSPVVIIEGTLMAPGSLEYFDSNWIEFKNLKGLVLEGGTGKLDAQGGVEAWNHSNCKEFSQCKKMITSLKFTNVSYGNIGNINVTNSKGFHVDFQQSDNINIRNMRISSPWDSPNTDGIHVGKSTNVNITSSAIGVGDDCVSIGPGSINISVSDVTCGPGHGISVGSLGKDQNEEAVIGIHVNNCTITNTQNGIRVKTWPGSHPGYASNLTFENVILMNVRNPVIIDQEYCPSNSCDISKPSLVKLKGIYVKNIIGSYISKSEVTLFCSSVVACENIQLIGVNVNCTTQDPMQSRLNLKGAVDGLQIIRSTF